MRKPNVVEYEEFQYLHDRTLELSLTVMSLYASRCCNIAWKPTPGLTVKASCSSSLTHPNALKCHPYVPKYRIIIHKRYIEHAYNMSKKNDKKWRRTFTKPRYNTMANWTCDCWTIRQRLAYFAPARDCGYAHVRVRVYASLCAHARVLLVNQTNLIIFP